MTRSLRVLLTVLLLAFAVPTRAEAFFENYRKGPHLVAQFPHLYNLSYELRHKTKDFSWGLGLGYVPQISLDDTYRVGVANIDVRARWHPFSGAFFLGAALGSHTITASGRDSIQVASEAVPILGEVKLTAPYFAPHMGWMWIIGSGFTIGLEFGSMRGGNGRSDIDLTIEDPGIGATLDQVRATAEYQNFESELEDSLGKLGKVTLPYFGIRLGWTF